MVITTANPIHPLTLDHNEQLPIAVQYTDEALHLAIDLQSLADPEKLAGDNEGHFQRGFKLLADGQLLHVTPTYREKKLEFKTSDFPADAKQLTLTLYGQPVVTLDHMNGQFIANAAHWHERLTVDEIRMIADFDKAPDPEDKLPIDRALLKGFDPAKHAPITDLHTHSSAQLSAEKLMALAVDNQLDYPLELLGKLGVTDLSEDEYRAIKFGGGKGSRFSPLEHEGLLCEKQNEPCDVIPLSALTPEHRLRVQEQLKVPQDKIICFSDFDKQYYRFVNPLVKNPKITLEMLMQIARDYRANGIQYAELSTASMLNLDGNGQAKWFEEMIEAVDAAKKETGVDLRFLISVPRNYTADKIMNELNKIKFAARHPLIAGVDLVGYEYNRTSNFTTVLGHIARWARESEGTELKKEDGWDFKRDFTIRIHAGETRKNNGNVAEAVHIAEKYGIHVRIAHAVNEKTDPQLDRTIARLSEKHPPEVSIEFCPPSNIAYNNVQDVREVPFTRWLKSCKSWFLGSDGAGAIQTTPTQIALSAMAAGVTIKQLAAMHKTEERFIADQQKNVAAKSLAYKKLYEEKAGNGKTADENFLAAFSEHVTEINSLTTPPKKEQKEITVVSRSRETINSELSALAHGKGTPPAPNLPKAFDKKMPILVAGASGDSIEGVNSKTRLEIKRAMHMLVAATDPDHAYFVMGRSKSEGVTAALDEAILAYNEMHPNKKFEVLALVTQGTSDLPQTFTYAHSQPGNIDSVPDNLINFMRAQLNPGKIPGISVFIGGSNFTGDMIRKCKDGQGKLDYLVMDNAPGASMQFAKKLSPPLRFSNGADLLTRVTNRLAKRAINVFHTMLNVTKGPDLETLEAAAIAQHPTYLGKSMGANAPEFDGREIS